MSKQSSRQRPQRRQPAGAKDKPPAAGDQAATRESKRAQAARAARETKAAQQAKRKQRQATRKQTRAKSGRGHVGWAGMRRSRRQKLGIAAVAAAGIALIWIFAEWQLAIGLTALLLVALPAFVVLTMGRRY